MSKLMALENFDEMVGAEPIDPDFLLDPYLPVNDRFYQTQQDIQRKINHARAQLKARQRQIIDLTLAGKQPKYIAKHLQITPQTVYKTLKRPEAVRLASLMNLLAQHNSGPTTEHKQHLLWRIALDNEEKRPATTIAAIQEMNKMGRVYEQGTTDGNHINITINNEALPKGELDRMPQTYESRAHLNEASN